MKNCISLFFICLASLLPFYPVNAQDTVIWPTLKVEIHDDLMYPGDSSIVSFLIENALPGDTLFTEGIDTEGTVLFEAAAYILEKPGANIISQRIEATGLGTYVINGELKPVGRKKRPGEGPNLEPPGDQEGDQEGGEEDCLKKWLCDCFEELNLYREFRTYLAQSAHRDAANFNEKASECLKKLKDLKFKWITRIGPKGEKIGPFRYTCYKCYNFILMLEAKESFTSPAGKMKIYLEILKNEGFNPCVQLAVYNELIKIDDFRISIEEKRLAGAWLLYGVESFYHHNYENSWDIPTSSRKLEYAKRSLLVSKNIFQHLLSKHLMSRPKMTRDPKAYNTAFGKWRERKEYYEKKLVETENMLEKSRFKAIEASEIPSIDDYFTPHVNSLEELCEKKEAEDGDKK